MKKIFILLVVLDCVLIFVGCSSQKVQESPRIGTTDQQLTLEQIIVEIEKKGISEVNIYKSERHGIVGKTLIKKLSSVEEFSLVLRSIKTSNQRLGILDTATPNNDFVIQLKNDDRVTFQYWLQADDTIGMFVNINDTGTGYSLSKKSTQELLKLIE